MSGASEARRGEMGAVRDVVARAIRGDRFAEQGEVPHGFYEMADRVLDALGLEQVGWVCDAFGCWHHLPYDQAPDDDPLYVSRPRSTRSPK